MNEDLQDWNFVHGGFEKGVKAQLREEGNPLLAFPNEGSDMTKSHSLDRCLCSSAEMIVVTKADGGLKT